MNKLLALVLVFFSLNSNALERKDITEVSIKEITSDTQAQPEGSGDNHLCFVWWVPFEYWVSVLSRDTNISNSVKKEMFNVLKEYMVIGVVQSDVSVLGSFDFYSKEFVLKNLKVSYMANNKKEIYLSPGENISSDMQLLMGQIGPILKAAMGNMGANFHFFIYRDLNEKGSRIIDPYEKGNIRVKLSNRNGEDLQVEFQTPLNSLYIPRTCPNGEKAHVSWDYCPWSGKKLQK